MHNMQPECHRLWNIVDDWSVRDLDYLLQSLLRNRSFTLQNLSDIVYTKSCNDIRDLLNAVLVVDDSYLTEPDAFGPVKDQELEGPTDVLLQSTFHMGYDDYTFSRAIGCHLEEFSTALISATKSSSSKTAGTSKLSNTHHFLASLTSERPLDGIRALESTPSLNLINTLIRLSVQMPPWLTGLAKNPGGSKQYPQPPFLHEDVKYSVNWHELARCWRAIRRKTVDTVALYLATCAACFTTSRRYLRSTIDDLVQQHPVAPYLLLNRVQVLQSTSARRNLFRALLAKLTSEWNVPRMPEDSDPNCLDNPDDVTTIGLIRRLAASTLNPFNLSQSLIAPFEQLVSILASHSPSPTPYSVSRVFHQFQTNFKASSVDCYLPRKRSGSREATYSQAPQKRHCGNTRTQKYYVTFRKGISGTNVKQVPGPWRPSDFFLRVDGEETHNMVSSMVRDCLVQKKVETSHEKTQTS